MALDLGPRGCSHALVARRNAMLIPIVCLDARVRQWASNVAAGFSKPHYQHFVTVLLGLLSPRGACLAHRSLTRRERHISREHTIT